MYTSQPAISPLIVELEEVLEEELDGPTAAVLLCEGSNKTNKGSQYGQY